MRFDPNFPQAGRRETGRRGPWLRLLSEVLQLGGTGAEILAHAETPWSSATFTGARHRITLAFDGTDAAAVGEAYIAALPEHEFTVSGHLVADAAIVSVEHRQAPTVRMTVEADLLLLEDC